MTVHTPHPRPLNAEQHAGLVAAVQANCDIADARHAREYSLCVYLLKMREYFRWEQGHGFGASLPGEEVGNWVTAREGRWDTLEDQDYQPVRWNGSSYAPFESAEINTALLPHGLVYSGGYGRGGAAHFFLGELLRQEHYGDHTLLVSGREFARDLTAPPGMSHDGTIFIRRESLRRMLWEKVEEWRWHRYDNAMGRALSYYDLDGDLQGALECMTDNEIETVLLHEIGELQAGERLGEAWHDMLATLPHSRAEIMARAVRDHLADCLTTLPALVERNNPAQLHFYFGNLRAMRKEIFPALMQAYRLWCDHGDLEPLHSQATRGAEHWQRIGQDMLAMFAQSPKDGDALAALVEAAQL